MTIEHAAVHMHRKPWGSTDLLPWAGAPANGDAIGELWFERADATAPKSALLLKLLFTSEPLSIQVHPDDDFARSIDLPNGKAEAWYILSATPGAQVAVGLKHLLTATELRASIEDGSIAEKVQWRAVCTGDVISVPAGTVHAIGAGIVLAEIQQQSDATFRLFDYGRQRGLHVDHAVAVAKTGPADPQPQPRRLNKARAALIVSPHFVLEQLNLPARSIWTLDAPKETWVLVLGGHARIGSIDAHLGDVIFMDADRADIEIGAEGMTGLLAYLGPNVNSGALEQQSNVSVVTDPISVRSPATQTASEHLPPLAKQET
ncbi:mannose-6-phosphate isomerase [Afipia sp. Root123D2]|uniref:class I mannose-6-phosphate isomerase n=1 Tax=Afipia sp. Root123D2 TaxID=1736436 RepID=UPI0007022A65|nr:class I mannose-6-phosphate isomerase [Afipia sp. Root123D2]KQW20640.1 mannose-6-phosphate isomerase [Afipia sp. Root123D2]